jgi:hypothetical protein
MREDKDSIREQMTEDREYHKIRMDKMDKLLDKLENRLPLWTTTVLAGLGTTIGYLISALKY